MLVIPRSLSMMGQALNNKASSRQLESNSTLLQSSKSFQMLSHLQNLEFQEKIHFEF